MNAVEDNPSVTSLTNAVSNFGMAYAATQESLRNNNLKTTTPRQQHLHQCHAGANPNALQCTWQPAPCRHASILTANQPGTLSTRGPTWPTTKPRQEQCQPSGGGGGTNNVSGRNRLCKGNGNGSGYNQGSGMTFNCGGGSHPTQGTSNPPSPIKKFNNWNYCHTHGGNIHNNHTSAICAQPGVDH